MCTTAAYGGSSDYPTTLKTMLYRWIMDLSDTAAAAGDVRAS